MAHVTKFKMTSMGQIFAHVNRNKNLTRKYGNADIDVSRTHLNYDLKHGTIETLQKRLEEVSHTKRHDLVACCGVVVTLPGELENEPEHTQTMKAHRICITVSCRQLQSNVSLGQQRKRGKPTHKSECALKKS